MSASSLIFVVIFAVWAAFMLQHWVRRREDLATARSVDRFSEAMRLLERRSPQVVEDVSPAHRSASHSSVLRPVRVGVRDEAAGATPASRSKSLAATTPRGIRFSLASSQAKLGLLASTLVFLVLTLALALFGVVPAWLPLIGIATVGGALVWVRHLAVRSRGVERAEVTVAPAASTRARPARTDLFDGEAGARAAAAAPVARRSPLVAEAVRPPVEEKVFDQEPDMKAVARAEAEVFDAGWEPVSVPRPTYTMKARAERVEVAPAATVRSSLPLAAYYENTPVEELPFDGMALDEDYEELPQFYRAG